MLEFILGISSYYHDSAAVLLCDGIIVAAAQEERFTRKKHDSSFPANSVQYVCDEAGICLKDISTIVFYDKPFIKFERLLETYHAFAPNGLKSFLAAIPLWIKEKLFLKDMLKRELEKLGTYSAPLLFSEHHLSHAASAFYPSPFKDAAILTVDGVGEWTTTAICAGSGTDITILKELHFPHSLGLLYSAFTGYCGFKVNSGEYKLMGLAPYGNSCGQTESFVKKITDTLVDIREDGSLLLNMKYFKFAVGFTMCNNARWTELFGIPPRAFESEITQPYMDMALAIQRVTEEIMLKLASTARKLTNMDNLVMAGGVALNCTANGKILQSKIFKKVWVQPASGDAGGALGAAYSAWYIGKNRERVITADHIDSMQGSYLGPDFNDKCIGSFSKKNNAPCCYYHDFDALCDFIAQCIDNGNVVGWFQGRMEFGPRALGNRSILGDARNPGMQKKLNLSVKYREGFRPFAPSVLEEDTGKFFESDNPLPYMLFTVKLRKEHLKVLPESFDKMSMLEKLYCPRSDIPAVTHVDFSARVQSVNKNLNERYGRLLDAFKRKTGYGVLINTSFNVRGEPIVCTPEDAYRCFMRTEMDWLVMENYVFDKKKQNWLDNSQEFNDNECKSQFELD